MVTFAWLPDEDLMKGKTDRVPYLAWRESGYLERHQDARLAVGRIKKARKAAIDV